MRCRVTVATKSQRIVQPCSGEKIMKALSHGENRVVNGDVP